MPASLAPATRMLLSKAFGFAVACFFTMALSAAEFGTAKVASVHTVYDSDTFRVNISDWPAVVGESMPVRIKGVDTPELRGKCRFEKDAAIAAKQFSVARLWEGELIELRFIERDKYFRLLAEVWIDGVSLGAQLLSAGLAVPYDGGNKRVWC